MQDKIHRFTKPSPSNLGTVFPVKVLSMNNDGTFNGTFYYSRMNAVKRILATKYV